VAHDNSLLALIAIRSSHLEMAKWLVQEKYSSITTSNYAYSEAAKTGDIAILEWLLENNCPLEPGDESIIYINAAENGQFCVFQWAKEGNCIPFDPIVVRLCLLRSFISRTY
jgi:hypothetical protein